MHNLTEDELDKIKKVLEQLDDNLALADVDCAAVSVCALDIVDLRDAFEEKLGVDVDTVTVGQALKSWDKISIKNSKSS